MEYIDGFVAAVPTANREKYRKHAAEAAEVFKQYGAVRTVEAWGDDVPTGKTTSFPQAVKLEPGETVARQLNKVLTKTGVSAEFQAMSWTSRSPVIQA